MISFRRASVVLALSVLISCFLGSAILTASTAQNNAERVSDTILCSVFPIFALAREIASGSHLSIDLLLPADLGCPHHYALTPGDFSRLSKARVLVMSGLGFEPFVGRLTQDAASLPRIVCASGLPTIVSADEPGEINAHVFTTPAGIISMGNNLAVQLATIDPTGTDLYKKNAANLGDQLAPLVKAFSELAAQTASLPVILTHDSLDYLARDLGLRVIARLGEDSSGETSELSVKRLTELVNLIRRERPLAILIDGTAISPISATLIRETGIYSINLPLLTTGEENPSPDFLRRHFEKMFQLLSKLVEIKKEMR
ncbi:MAG: zinc ABC transporter substrate-binding protein [Candidatus Riflebacteria bacterium]|nr:zinc ABC transporter substrate-binding protein [Candidatus Riflebacteria bacterium]